MKGEEWKVGGWRGRQNWPLSASGAIFQCSWKNNCSHFGKRGSLARSEKKGKEVSLLHEEDRLLRKKKHEEREEEEEGDNV